MSSLPVKIAGTGYYLPERIVTSAELEAQWGLESGWIEKVTGVRERRYVTHETVLDMAVAAAQNALTAAGMGVADLDLIIGASTSIPQAIPCAAALLQRALGAPDGGSACFDVNATCLSFVQALHTAACFLAGGVYRAALIVSSEASTFSRNPREPESAVLFGDAAAAAVLVPTPPGEASAFWGARFATYGSGADLTRLLGGGALHHPNDPATTPEMNMFHMDGPGVFRQAVRLIPPFISEFLQQVGWSFADVDMVAPHQASRHAIDQLTRRFGFTPEQVWCNLAERGNCIAASIPLGLAEAVAAGRVRRGQRVLLAGTGAGLTLGAAAVTF